MLPLAPLAVAAPLLPWLAGRVVDGGALSLAAAAAGLVLVALGFAPPALDPEGAHVRTPAAWPAWPAWSAAAGGAVVVAAGAGLVSRALLVGGAVVAALSLACLTRGRARPGTPAQALVVVPGALLVALAAVHPADVDALVGWPLRTLLAHGAGRVLEAFGAAPIAAETILVVEGRVVDVESACAGTRSLTALAICFALLVAGRALLHPTRLPRASALAAAAGAACSSIVLLSVFRVAALTALAVLADVPRVAAAVHEPLGLLALLGALVVAHTLLTSAPPAPAPAPARVPSSVLAAALAAVVAVVAAVGVARVHASPASPPPPQSPSVQAAAGASAGTLRALTPAEEALYTQLGARARKFRLQPRGSVLFVDGPRRAQHSPERCLSAAGLHVESAVDVDVGGVAVRKLSLTRDGQAYVAFSFFTSRERVVAGVVERSVREVALGEGPWVFVSLLLPADDADHHFNEHTLRSLVMGARQTLGDPPP